MRRTVIYTRVSSKKHEQSLSLKNQEDHYSEWCKRNSYEMLHVYPEEGLTGTNARREQFQLMLSHAGIDYEENDDGMDILRKTNREIQFDYIVVKDPSRFSRDSVMAMAILKLLRDQKVFVIFENAGVSTEDENWRNYLNMLFSIAESESENMSKRIKFARKLNADKGLYRPARLPYGYERNSEGEFVVNEEEAKIVRFIYKNYTKQGSHILTRRLNEDNVPTQLGKKWSNDKVARIIKNLIYTGTAMVGRSEKRNVTDTKRIDIDKDDWIPIPNAVPEIVSLEDYEEANKIRESRINKSTKKGRKPSVNDIYYKKLYCQNCGSRFVRHVGVKEKITYVCQNRRKGQGCEVRGISVNNVNEVFDRVGVSSLMDGMSNHVGYNTLMNRIETETANLNSRRNVIKAEIKLLEEENNDLKQAFKRQLKDASQNVIDMFSKDIDENVEKINKCLNQMGKINISNIIKLKEKVESKKQLIDGIRFGKGINKDEKLELLKEIVIGDYECTTSFSFPNFEDEILEFNTIFPMSEIESVKVYHFTESMRRAHKSAREYWDDVDEARIDHEDYYRYHHNPEEDNLVGGGNYFGNGKNVGKEALEMEKLLDSTNN